MPPMRRLIASFGIFPKLGRPSRGRVSLLDIVLPGFCPAVYPFFKDCLSRTSRPPKQAGTLDAHLIDICANVVPSASRLLRAHGFSIKSRGVGVASSIRGPEDQSPRCF